MFWLRRNRATAEVKSETRVYMESFKAGDKVLFDGKPATVVDNNVDEWEDDSEGARDKVAEAFAELTARRARDAEVVAALIASELARIDGYDPDDEHGGLYDLRWSGGTNPEPEGDAWHMDYLPKGERIARAIAAALQAQQPQQADVANLLRYLTARLSYGTGELVHPDELPTVRGFHRSVWAAADALEAEHHRLVLVATNGDSTAPPEVQQPGAQAVAWIVRSDKLADAVTIYKGEAQTLARVRDGGSYAPLFTHPQPPSTPEPSGGDVDEAVAAFNESYLDDGSTKRAAIRAALTTYTARLRKRIGHAPQIVKSV